MTEASDAQVNYSVLLAAFATTHPSLAATLQKAQATRQERLQRYASGIRLRGLEELFVYLKDVEVPLQQHPDLNKVAFLVARARKDFETALETGLSGLHGVVADAMRDVMEIEFLLRDFSYTHAHIDEWLNADEKTRKDKFGANQLRQRHANHVNVVVHELRDSKDYKAHSVFLHVSPFRNPLGDKGFSSDQDPITADSWFQEIFEHARRLVIAIDKLLESFSLSTRPNPTTDLPNFRQAWKQTQEMQSIFWALASAANEGSEASKEPD